MKRKKERFGGINPFEMSITYVEIDSASPLNVNDDHIHNECEIYINLSGDVSFSVENSVYPVVPGSIIVTRPFEYHHCIYHSDKLHRHYCILFNAVGNERLLGRFFDREAGKNNLILPAPDKTEEIKEVCRKMADGCEGETEKYLCFFRLISLLNEASSCSAPKSRSKDCVTESICPINGNLTETPSVRALARMCNVSVNTLERRFVQELGVLPSEYIKKRRTANAVRLLLEGATVTEAAEMSGFSDCSGFIARFKKEYGITPLKYKKRYGG